MGAPQLFSIVIPIYNEEETLHPLAKRLVRIFEQIDGDVEVIFVDDGSQDSSFAVIAKLVHAEPRFKAVQLSRNFGHQVAITAGMDMADGDAVIIMDGDLQDPPEVMLDMIREWRAGFDVVYAIRDARDGETAFKRLTAAAFYRLFNRMTNMDVPVNVGDFRLVDRRALDAFKVMRENNRYVRGMFSWIGFRQTGVHFERDARAAGRTKYPLGKMIKFATDGIVSFSNAPLRFALKLGFLVSACSFVFGIVCLVAQLAGLYAVPGLASIAVATSFLGGMQLVILGVMGEYIAQIHEEVKDRPLYLVNDVQGFAERPLPQRRSVISSPRRSLRDATLDSLRDATLDANQAATH